MDTGYYFGQKGDSIEMTQPTDIYPLLDWCQNKMLENQENARTELNKEKWERSIQYLSELMAKVEKGGFGSHKDV